MTDIHDQYISALDAAFRDHVAHLFLGLVANTDPQQGEQFFASRLHTIVEAYEWAASLKIEPPEAS